MVRGGGGRVLIDCGEDWLGRVRSLRPAAILISHAHVDHAAGLKAGAPCGVCATAQAWQALAAWPLCCPCGDGARTRCSRAGCLRRDGNDRTQDEVVIKLTLRGAVWPFPTSISVVT